MHFLHFFHTGLKKNAIFVQHSTDMKKYIQRKGKKGADLWLDRFLSKSFVKVFGITFLVSTILLVGVFLIFRYYGSDITAVQAFIQLSNPTEWHDEGVHGINAAALVVLNLIGLFIINGVVLTLLVNWVSSRKDKNEKGQSRYSNVTAGNFTVIIGGHSIVPSLINNLFGNDRDRSSFILVQTSGNVEKLRKEIFAELPTENLREHVIIYSGDRTSWHELAELHCEKASAVYIIGESQAIDGSGHDALNLKCWDLLSRNIKVDKAPGQKIRCHIMFEYQSTFTAFQHCDVSAEESSTFRFVPFSFYDTWAQKVLDNTGTKPDPYIPLDGLDGIPYSSRERVHLIVIGMSKMGISLAVQATHIAHYPNFDNEAAGRPRTLITFIDRNARREMQYFIGRYREIFQLARWRFVKAPDSISPESGKWKIYDSTTDIHKATNQTYPWERPLDDESFGSPYFGGYLGEDFIDVDFEFIEGDVALPSIQKYLSEACADSRGVASKEIENTSRTTIAVCLPNDSEAASAAFYFPPDVYDNAQEILVQQSHSSALIDAVRKGKTGTGDSRYRKLVPFGMLDKCNYPPADDYLMAKCVAYAYSCMGDATDKRNFIERMRSHKNRQDFIDEIEDFWEKIEASNGKSATALRWSNVYCALSFGTKLRSTESSINDKEEFSDSRTIKTLARVEHTRWLFEQLLLGFRPVDKSLADKFPFNDNNDPSKKLRTELKNRGMHPDLVANSLLGNTSVYDEMIVSIIPAAISLAKPRIKN